MRLTMSYILITIVGFTTLIGLTGCSMTQNNEHNENTTRTDYTVNGGNDQLNVAYISNLSSNKLK